MSQTTLLLSCVVFVVLGSYVETKLLRDAVPYFYEPSDVMPALPRAFGFVIMVITYFGFWFLGFGMQVGKARGKYREKAQKDGEEDLDRYSYPNLYASGNTANAKAFNSVQRAHQHVLESLAQQLVGSVLTASVYPITTAVNLLFWTIGRINWSEKYAEGGPAKRYNHVLSTWIWRGLVINYMLSMLVALNFLFGSFY